MIEAVFANWYGILGAITLACFAAYLAWRNGYKGRRAAACSTFRASILTTLSGLYPPTEHWSESISDELQATLPGVKSACVAFEPYVSSFRRKALFRSYSDYEQQCKEKHPFPLLLAHVIDPKGFPEDPQITFSKTVAHLLSFADET